MNTFYRPGLVEMLLHGIFRRHSWFANQYVNARHENIVDILCRICLVDWGTAHTDYPVTSDIRIGPVDTK